MTERSIKLPCNTIHIWEINISKQNLETAKKYIQILSKTELDRLKLFKFFKDYSSYLISHVALRLLISKYNNLDAKAIIYQYNKNGKPSISQDLYFNLSYTYKKSIIGFYEKDIGIDIEYKKELDCYCEIATLIFSNDEKFYMIKNRDIKNRFYELWTKKEAVIKAMGGKLSEESKKLSIGIKKKFYEESNRTWQIERVKEDLKYVAHVAYNSNLTAQNIDYYMWNSSEVNEKLD